MKPSLKQTARFSHQLARQQKAARNTIAAGLFLRIGQLDEGFRSGVLHQQFCNDFGAVVGHGGFAVGFVEHFVKALRSEGALHKIAKRNGGGHQLLRDTHAAGDSGGRSNDGHGRPSAPVVAACHVAKAGALVLQTLFVRDSLFLGRGFLRRGFLRCRFLPVLAEFVNFLSLVV